MNGLDWQLKSFEELTKLELYKILRARSTVFVVEQDCPYQDVDEKDFAAVHLFLQRNDEVVAYCRLMHAGLNYEECSIGRVLTIPSIRHEGIGIALMKKAIEEVWMLWPKETIRISAQRYLERFYQSFGFEIVSEPYLEDNIPHVSMTLNPKTGN